MNLNFKVKRPLAIESSISTGPKLPAGKKQFPSSSKKVTSATEMGDSDVSLSDDDNDDMVKLSRSQQVINSRRDGSVNVPETSTIFLKVAEQQRLGLEI
jgi:hypothetical protein